MAAPAARAVRLILMCVGADIETGGIASLSPQPSQGRQCAFVHEGGYRCRAVPLTGKEFCFFHDPDSTELRRRAGVAGGRARARKVLAEARLSRLDSRESLIDLLSETVQQVRTGQIDPKVANAVGYLVNVARQILESDEYERLRRELEALKEQLGLSHERCGVASRA